MKKINRKVLIIGLVILICACLLGAFYLGKITTQKEKAKETSQKEEKTDYNIIEEDKKVEAESENSKTDKDADTNTSKEESTLSNSTTHQSSKENSNSSSASSNNSSNKNTTSSSSISGNQSTTTRDETAVISYFEEQQSLVTNANQNDMSLIEKVKSGFSTMNQFLFHGGTIKGYTFNELTTTAKLKVVKIALQIDNKIDSVFPNYKDKIKSGATNLKNKAIAKYLELTAKICESYPDTCLQARNDFKSMKESFGFTFSMIKDLIKEGSSALKEWYRS